MSRGGPPFSRELAEVRRAALIEAAVASLAERGVAAASVRDVAARAGVSPGLIGHHFGGFGALLVEAYRHVVARVVVHDRGLAGRAVLMPCRAAAPCYTLVQ